ncbi:MAG: hypothetical protein RLZZ158_1354 [Cyanobacteriota bacterium]
MLRRNVAHPIVCRGMGFWLLVERFLAHWLPVWKTFVQVQLSSDTALKRILKSSQGPRVTGALLEIRSMPLAA